MCELKLKCIVHTFKKKEKKILWTDKYKTSMKNTFVLQISPLNTHTHAGNQTHTSVCSNT